MSVIDTARVATLERQVANLTNAAGNAALLIDLGMVADAGDLLRVAIRDLGPPDVPHDADCPAVTSARWPQSASLVCPGCTPDGRIHFSPQGPSESPSPQAPAGTPTA